MDTQKCPHCCHSCFECPSDSPAHLTWMPSHKHVLISSSCFPTTGCPSTPPLIPHLCSIQKCNPCHFEMQPLLCCHGLSAHLLTRYLQRTGLCFLGFCLLVQGAPAPAHTASLSHSETQPSPFLPLLLLMPFPLSTYSLSATHRYFHFRMFLFSFFTLFVGRPSASLVQGRAVPPAHPTAADAVWQHHQCGCARWGAGPAGQSRDSRVSGGLRESAGPVPAGGCLTVAL